MRPRRGMPWFVPPLVLAAAIAVVALEGEDGRSDASERAQQSPPRRLTMTGRTTQGEPITAVVHGERLVAFDTELRLRCIGGDVGSTPRRLRWRAAVPSRGSDGLPTSGHGLTGTLLTSIAVKTPDGSHATCTAGGVRFRLER